MTFCITIFFRILNFLFFWFLWPFLIFRIPNLSFEPIKFFGRHISATYCPRVMKFYSHLPSGILHNYFFRNFEFPLFLGFLAIFGFFTRQICRQPPKSVLGHGSSNIWYIDHICNSLTFSPLKIEMIFLIFQVFRPFCKKIVLQKKIDAD